MVHLSPLLLRLYQLAKEAAELVFADAISQDFTVAIKDDGTPQTSTDICASKYLLDECKKRFAKEIAEHDLVVISEEEEVPSGTSNNLLLIDPIDGTHLFVNHHQGFAVMLALAFEGEVRFAVIYDVIGKNAIVAEKGHGAFFYETGVRLHVSETRSLANAVRLVSGNNCFEEFLAADVVPVSGILEKAILFGMGKADFAIYPDWKTLHAWDIAPLDLIVREAGGRVTDFSGNPLVYSTENLTPENGIVISNALLHDQIVAELYAHLKKK
ncbi:MAG: hypothetical protein H6502_02205 [Candidatus Woesearchaeota archaeon]|nr:MAG: hypothetical protein H6502_02205 [Candidatus Woesearchaeota archaeon]